MLIARFRIPLLSKTIGNPVEECWRILQTTHRIHSLPLVACIFLQNEWFRLDIKSLLCNPYDY